MICRKTVRKISQREESLGFLVTARFENATTESKTCCSGETREMCPLAEERAPEAAPGKLDIV